MIAIEYHLDPREVKRWDAEDVMEALAFIRERNKETPKGGKK